MTCLQQAQNVEPLHSDSIYLGIVVGNIQE
jgi:hypothetical protein